MSQRHGVLYTFCMRNCANMEISQRSPAFLIMILIKSAASPRFSCNDLLKLVIIMQFESEESSSGFRGADGSTALFFLLTIMWWSDSSISWNICVEVYSVLGLSWFRIPRSPQLINDLFHYFRSFPRFAIISERSNEAKGNQIVWKWENLSALLSTSAIMANEWGRLADKSTPWKLVCFTRFSIMNSVVS